jgi:hypothetical protein
MCVIPMQSRLAGWLQKMKLGRNGQASRIRHFGVEQFGWYGGQANPQQRKRI